jgi:hypothetical protein
MTGEAVKNARNGANAGIGETTTGIGAATKAYHSIAIPGTKAYSGHIEA